MEILWHEYDTYFWHARVSFSIEKKNFWAFQLNSWMSATFTINYLWPSNITSHQKSLTTLTYLNNQNIDPQVVF